MRKTKVFRDTRSNLPTSLPLGELAFANDTEELFVGQGEGQSLKKVGRRDLANLQTLMSELKLNVSENLKGKTDVSVTEQLQQQINDLVLGAVGDGNNAEVVQARNGFDTLNDRLNKYDTLEPKVNLLVSPYNTYSGSVQHGNTGGECLGYSVNLESSDGYIEINNTYSQGSSKAIFFDSKYLCKELQFIIIEGRFEIGCENTGFVGLGSSFYWGNMNITTIKDGVDFKLTFDPRDIPNINIENGFKIFIGTKSSTNLRGKFKFSYRMIKAEQCVTVCDLADVSILSNHSLSSDTSEHSDYAINSKISINSGCQLFNLEDITYNRNFFTVTDLGNGKYELENTGCTSASTYWGAFYIKIPYSNLEELNKTFSLNFKFIEGASYLKRNVKIVPRDGSDWNPMNKPIDLGEKTSYNLYEAIMKCDETYISQYTSLNALYLLVSSETDSTGSIHEHPFKWEIQPRFDLSNCIVVASEVTPTLHNDLMEATYNNIKSNINTIPIGISYAPAQDYTVRENVNNLVKVTPIEPYGVNVKKESTEVGTKYAGVYVKITYSSLDDLDGMLTVYHKKNSGADITTTNILYGITDWGPNTGSVPYPINTPFNLKEHLEKSSNDYSNRNVLYLTVLRYSSKGVADTMDFNVNVEFIPTKQTTVVATHLNENLKSDLEANTTQLVNDLTPPIVKEYIQNNPIGTTRLPIKDYLIRNNNGLATLSQKGKWINVSKTEEASATNYAGVYIKISYDSIDDLDGELIARYVINKGSNLTNKYILYNVSDWGQGAGQGVIHLPINEKFNLKELLLKSGLGYENRKHLYLCIVRYSASGVTGAYDYDFQVQFTHKDTQDICATELSSDLMEELKTEFKNLNGNANYITCWGDSLTAGGGWTNTLQELTGLTVYNGGTGGENSRTIIARQGGDIMMVNNLTIPSTKTPVVVATRQGDTGISTYFGHKVTPLLQGGSHVNPCYIGDIKGTLRWTGTAYNDMNGTWTFTRETEGDEVVINRPTAIRTDFDINKNAPKIMIIFIGQNGGYTDVAELIRQHRYMIEHSDCEDFLVLGLSSGTASARKSYEDAMRLEFGRRFVSLREYLSTYGLEDAGIEPTEQDLSMMTQGQTPQSLLSDSVHYNSACKTVIGNMLYRKIKELNML